MTKQTTDSQTVTLRLTEDDIATIEAAMAAHRQQLRDLVTATTGADSLNQYHANRPTYAALDTVHGKLAEQYHWNTAA